MSWVLAHLLLLAFSTVCTCTCTAWLSSQFYIPVVLCRSDGNFGISLATVLGFVSCGCMCTTYSTELIDQIRTLLWNSNNYSVHAHA